MILDDPSTEKVIDSYGEEVRQPSSRLWRSILGEYDLDEHESVLLTEHAAWLIAWTDSPRNPRAPVDGGKLEG